jgi:hypothetical protein
MLASTPRREIPDPDVPDPIDVERMPETERPPERPEDRRPDAPTDRYIMEPRPPYRMLRIKT